MKSAKVKIAVIACVGLALGACASKPPVQDEVAVVTPPSPDRGPIETSPRGPVDTGPVRSGPAAGSIDDFRINVGERVYFDTDRYNVDNYDLEILDRQAAWLQAYPGVRVMVAGNCDERGTREYNLGLGERRANSVKDYLVSKGVSPSRIETISYGKEKPIDGGSNEQAWEINRNAHTQIVSGQLG